jgi:hypothetical protein
MRNITAENAIGAVARVAALLRCRAAIGAGAEKQANDRRKTSTVSRLIGTANESPAVARLCITFPQLP